MGTELRIQLDQHLMDRIDALHLLYQETFPHRPMHREELLRRAVEEGLQGLLADLLLAPERCTAGGRKFGRRWKAA